MALFSTLNNELELVEDIHFCHIVYMCILGHSTLIRGPLGEMDSEQEVLPLTKCMLDISLHSLCYTFRNLQFVLFIADAGKTYDDILD
jgi:hypothetical protein